MSLADSIVVLDFETTGLSPNQGDRAIEIGAVRLQNGHIVDRFQALMNPGMPVSPFIESYTGITNAMLDSAESCTEVMQQFLEFLGTDNMVAHNASFDKRFLDAELQRISLNYSGEFSCSLLAARRIFQHSPNYKLETLVDLVNIPTDGTYHRALYDAEMTAKVWMAMLSSLAERYQLSTIPFSLIQSLNKKPKKSINQYMSTISV